MKSQSIDEGFKAGQAADSKGIGKTETPAEIAINTQIELRGNPTQAGMSTIRIPETNGIHYIHGSVNPIKWVKALDSTIWTLLDQSGNALFFGEGAAVIDPPLMANAISITVDSQYEPDGTVFGATNTNFGETVASTVPVNPPISSITCSFGTTSWKFYSAPGGTGVVVAQGTGTFAFTPSITAKSVHITP